MFSKEWFLPAEWEAQDAVWFSWPVSTHIWLDRRNRIAAKFAEIVAAAAQFQPVCVNARGSHHRIIGEHLNRAGCLDRVTLFDHPTNDVWCRDHGPIFMKHRASGEIAIGNWRFNAWGGKYEPWHLDNEVPVCIANSLGLPARDIPWVLEGGAIESNGAGIILTTTSVMLNPNRELPRDRDEVERVLCDGLAADRIVWLEHGLPNDDTDGHIDNIARFFGPSAVLAVDDPNLSELSGNLRVLRENFDTVVTLPRPKTDGPPRSYANFLILNQAVLLPVFGQQMDDEAIRIVAGCFPGREVVPIDCNLLLEEGGAIHCLSMQQPR